VSSSRTTALDQLIPDDHASDHPPRRRACEEPTRGEAGRPVPLGVRGRFRSGYLGRLGAGDIVSAPPRELHEPRPQTRLHVLLDHIRLSRKGRGRAPRRRARSTLPSGAGRAPRSGARSRAPQARLPNRVGECRPNDLFRLLEDLVERLERAPALAEAVHRGPAAQVNEQRLGGLTAALLLASWSFGIVIGTRRDAGPPATHSPDTAQKRSKIPHRPPPSYVLNVRLAAA
jgi:hypothetical protein